MIPVGIVGGGRVGEAFVRSLQSEHGIAVIGIVSGSAARRQELAKTYGWLPFRMFPALMKADPAFVCVVNATEDHATATITALADGANVYCEKPMALTFADCKAMVAAERSPASNYRLASSICMAR